MPALSNRPWRRISREIDRQASVFGGLVEHLVVVDDGQKPSGLKRQELLSRSTGEYVAFVDDDDRVSPDYVQSLIASIGDTDVVTFNLRMSTGEIWSYGLHEDDRKHSLMCANHLCAWRRDLATAVGWCPHLGYGDDQLWYKPLFASRLPKYAQHVPRVLYYYDYSPKKSVNQRVSMVRFARRHVGRGLRCFRDEQGRLLVETKMHHGQVLPPGHAEVTVRYPDGKESVRPIKGLKHFYTVRLG